MEFRYTTISQCIIKKLTLHSLVGSPAVHRGSPHPIKNSFTKLNHPDQQLILRRVLESRPHQPSTGSTTGDHTTDTTTDGPASSSCNEDVMVSQQLPPPADNNVAENNDADEEEREGEGDGQEEDEEDGQEDDDDYRDTAV
ncbi:hypothetical protein JTE90_006604 [Oedothorax gibbosus]|uniref:Uncharacterized protein n=1 Tax=Oedothorax gibbosus TaxID=931172 RepID=A0AAV6U3W4_9ARAC|nr:hypothetical protein JTE90_006604 [Oedothorax gibbosus]